MPPLHARPKRQVFSAGAVGVSTQCGFASSFSATRSRLKNNRKSARDKLAEEEL